MVANTRAAYNCDVARAASCIASDPRCYLTQSYTRKQSWRIVGQDIQNGIHELAKQQTVAGAPLPIVAIVAGLQAHLNYTVGTGAIRSLMFERYVGDSDLFAISSDPL